MTEAAPGVSIPRDPSTLDAPKINQLYLVATEHLKSKISYIWPGNENEEQRSRQEKWLVATWSTKIGRSQVIKCGTLGDQSNLAAATRYNMPHSHRPRKQRRVTRHGFRNQHDAEEVDKTLRVMVRDLGTKTQERVEREIAEVRQEEDQKRYQIRKTVNENGDPLIVVPGTIRGCGPSGVDPDYAQQIRRIIDVEHENVEYGHCGILGCTHPELDLRFKCHTCEKYVHNPCAIDFELLDEGNSTHGLSPRRYCSPACKPN